MNIYLAVHQFLQDYHCFVASHKSELNENVAQGTQAQLFCKNKRYSYSIKPATHDINITLRESIIVVVFQSFMYL